MLSGHGTLDRSGDLEATYHALPAGEPRRSRASFAHYNEIVGLENWRNLEEAAHKG